MNRTGEACWHTAMLFQKPTETASVRTLPAKVSMNDADNVNDAHNVKDVLQPLRINVGIINTFLLAMHLYIDVAAENHLLKNTKVMKRYSCTTLQEYTLSCCCRCRPYCVG
jgi:hypothetical protein